MTVVTPLQTHWGYCSLALSHSYIGQTELNKETPYLTLTGELWGIYWKYFRENRAVVPVQPELFVVWRPHVKCMDLLSMESMIVPFVIPLGLCTPEKATIIGPQGAAIHWLATLDLIWGSGQFEGLERCLETHLSLGQTGSSRRDAWHGGRYTTSLDVMVVLNVFCLKYVWHEVV